jgi:hypothetical protein
MELSISSIFAALLIAWTFLVPRRMRWQRQQVLQLQGDA